MLSDNRQMYIFLISVQIFTTGSENVNNKRLLSSLSNYFLWMLNKDNSAEFTYFQC